MLQLTGTASLNGTGNTLANSPHRATTGNNILDGQGRDRHHEQAAMATTLYVVDHAGDVVSESNILA
jgi:hypothetical protein